MAHSAELDSLAVVYGDMVWLKTLYKDRPELYAHALDSMLSVHNTDTAAVSAEIAALADEPQQSVIFYELTIQHLESYTGADSAAAPD